jgi:tRNA(fMet)-specific endonuclease VapC
MLMSGKFLLDTNIIIALFADETIVKDNLAQAGEVFIPSNVVGELCYGARKSGRVETNLARVNELATGGQHQALRPAMTPPSTFHVAPVTQEA